MMDRQTLRHTLIELLEADTGEKFADLQDEANLREGLGLDSVDALQLVVGLDKTFGLKIADPAAAKQILRSVNTIAEAVLR